MGVNERARFISHSHFCNILKFYHFAEKHAVYVIPLEGTDTDCSLTSSSQLLSIRRRTVPYGVREPSKTRMTQNSSKLRPSCWG